mmetsp:Transcript_27819/g.73002  ORF Transcript_27819/g.73002 Transcript_27819/m.73002 type:complete len:271 (+) Transcript_27819:487-1299(+)
MDRHLVTSVLKHLCRDGLLATGKRAEPLVDRNVHGPEVALKVLVMELVEVVTRSRPLEAVMAKPCSNGTVNDAPEENRRMALERHADQCGRIVQRRLHRMHVGPRKGGRVVTLVVQRMHVAVHEAANVGDPPFVVLGKPRMHPAVNRPEVRDPPVSDGDGPQKVRHWCLPHVRLVLHPAGGPQVAHPNFKRRRGQRGHRGEEYIVLHLLPRWVDWVHLVLVQLFFERGRVQKPVPQPSNEPCAQQVAHDDRRDPVGRPRLSPTERGVVIG